MFWDIIPCSLVDDYLHFGEICHLNLHPLRTTIVHNMLEDHSYNIYHKYNLTCQIIK